jgi:hypothetical protein
LGQSGKPEGAQFSVNSSEKVQKNLKMREILFSLEFHWLRIYSFDNLFFSQGAYTCHLCIALRYWWKSKKAIADSVNLGDANLFTFSVSSPVSGCAPAAITTSARCCSTHGCCLAAAGDLLV